MLPLDPLRFPATSQPMQALILPPTLSPTTASQAAQGLQDTFATQPGSDALASSAPVSAPPQALQGLPKRGFVEGVDGFVAYDPGTGKVLGGRPPGGRLRKKVRLPKGLDTVSKVAARGVEGEQLGFRLQGQSLEAVKPTNRQGEQRLDLTQLGTVQTQGYTQPVTLEVGCGELPPAQARVLALPANYDGPVFVTDIDDTLRATKASALLEGKVQPPLPGARELLESVAAMGIPIVYLSAAPSQLHSVNEQFLKQLPPGVLLDHPRYRATNFLPGHAHQASVQGAYKTRVLEDLQSTFPQARFYELGDNKYGDAVAYSQVGQQAYIHNVRPDQAFVPDGFRGVLVDHFHKEFRNRVLDDLTHAVQSSASLGGSPSVSLPKGSAGPANPEPIQKQSFARRMRTELKYVLPPRQGAARKVARSLRTRLKAHRAPLDFARHLTDAELAAAPPRTLAVLGEHLLRSLSKRQARKTDQAAALSQQFVRVLAARGTDAGHLDYLLSQIRGGDRASDLLVGPARLTYLALRQTPPVKPGDWAAWNHYLDQATATRAVSNSRTEVLVDGTKAFPRVLADIDKATASVNFCVFDFQSDEAGWDYARHLAAAADRGCEVRFIYDPVGSHKSNGMPTDPGVFDYLKEHGVQVLPQKPGVLPNHMMHRKILVLDGKVGYMGGMNVGDEYRDLWHDVHCRVEGPAVHDLQALYLKQWQQDGGRVDAKQLKALFPKVPDQAVPGTVRIVGHEGRSDKSIALAYLRSIDTATSSIQIADPYLTDPEIISHLCKAARRGVDVQVVLPKTNIHKFEQLAERGNYHQMLNAGVKIYEYGGAPMLHAKVASFDHKVATIGSSNLDAQSLSANDESNLWTDNHEVVAGLERDFFASTIAASDKVLAHDPRLMQGALESATARLHRLL